VSDLAPQGDNRVQTVAETGLCQEVLNGIRNLGPEHEPEEPAQILAALTTELRSVEITNVIVQPVAKELLPALVRQQGHLFV